MKFKKEEDMYESISEYFKKEGYETIIDKPARTGIKFDLLKGWYVDVAGIKRDKNPQELIAVEAKNNLGAQSVVQAISQAEMYKSAFNKVYVAFPESDLDSNDNEEVINEIIELCDAKGIGILKVGKVCEEVLKATPSYLKVDIYRDIINQFKPAEFDGFELEDFERYFYQSYGEAYDLVWTKFRLLVKSLEKRLKRKGLVLTYGPTSGLVDVHEGIHRTEQRFWATFSDIGLKDEHYVDVPSFIIKWLGHGTLVELILGPSHYLDNLITDINNDDTRLYNILKDLKKIENYYCDIKVQEVKKIEKRGYGLTVSSEYVLHSENLKRENYQEFIQFLKARKKIYFVVDCFFHIIKEDSPSKNLLSDIENLIDNLMDLYKYLIQKEEK